MVKNNLQNMTSADNSEYHTVITFDVNLVKEDRHRLETCYMNQLLSPMDFKWHKRFKDVSEGMHDTTLDPINAGYDVIFEMINIVDTLLAM